MENERSYDKNMCISVPNWIIFAVKVKHSNINIKNGISFVLSGATSIIFHNAGT